MRLGGPIEKVENPDAWVRTLRDRGYSAALWPTDIAADNEIEEWLAAARAADIVIAEVSAFGNNPISPDDGIRQQGIANCQRRLALADRVGARCCVNVAGSRSERWAGIHEDNLTDATFDLIVESVRAIIDAVSPTRTFYTLETMPWMYPDSADSYLRLVEAVAREQFAVHFDPVNLVCSPQRYYGNADLIRDFLARLGPHTRSCHGKDILLRDQLTTHLDEVRPGLGGLDYGVFLQELDKLAPDTPLMLEHLATQEDYDLAAEHIRAVAKEVGVTIR